jgi:protein disulfide-isomerase-like protein
MYIVSISRLPFLEMDWAKIGKVVGILALLLLLALVIVLIVRKRGSGNGCSGDEDSTVQLESTAEPAAASGDDSASPAAADKVIDATPASLEKILKSAHPVVVLFYAPWCGHCKTVKPVWQQLPTKVRGGSVHILQIDCERYREAAAKYSIQGFPTIKKFSQGRELATYKGDRSLGDMAAFAMQQ